MDAISINSKDDVINVYMQDCVLVQVRTFWLSFISRPGLFWLPLTFKIVHANFNYLFLAFLLPFLRSLNLLFDILLGRKIQYSNSCLLFARSHISLSGTDLIARETLRVPKNWCPERHCLTNKTNKRPVNTCNLWAIPGKVLCALLSNTCWHVDVEHCLLPYRIFRIDAIW